MTSRGPNDLSPDAERELLRRLTGERAGGAAPADPAAGRLAALWELLEPPPAAPAPPGFAGRVMARVREEAAPGARRATGLGTAWARAAGAAALAAGIVAGAGLGRVALVPPAGGPTTPGTAAAVAPSGAAEPVDELAADWSDSLSGDALSGDEGLAAGYAEAISAIGEGEDDR